MSQEKIERIKGQIEIDLEKETIVVPDYPIREQTEEEYQRLVKSIKSLGFIAPIVVVVQNGRFVVIDGRHRLKIAREFGLKKIPAVVLDIEEGESEEVLAASLEVCRKFLSQEEIEMLNKRLIWNDSFSDFSTEKELEEVVSDITEKSYEEIVKLSRKVFSEKDIELLREKIREEVENELRESFEIEKEELEKQIEARVKLRLEQELRAKLRDEYKEVIKKLEQEKEDLQIKLNLFKDELGKKEKEISILTGKMSYHDKAVKQALADYAKALGYETLFDYFSTISSVLDSAWKIIHLWSYRNERFLSMEQRDILLGKYKEIQGKFQDFGRELIAITAACCASFDELVNKVIKQAEKEQKEPEEENPEFYGLTSELWETWGGKGNEKRKESVSMKKD